MGRQTRLPWRARRAGPGLLPLLGGLLLGACGDAPPAADGSVGTTDTVVVVDDAGRSVSVPSPPERVVSLVPSVTRLLLELGAGDRLVGRTDFDTARVLQELPSVGGGLGPSAEVLASLRPDLVIRFAGDSDTDTPARMDEMGIPHLAVRPDGIDDVRRIILLVGRVTGRIGEARALVGRMDAGLDSVRAAVAGLPEVRTAFVLGGETPWVAGPGTFVDELIDLAGGRNVFGDLDRLYGPVSPEEMRARPMDVVLVGPAAGIPTDLLGSARVAPLPSAVEQPGHDLAEAARAVAAALHPELGW